MYSLTSVRRTGQLLQPFRLSSLLLREFVPTVVAIADSNFGAYFPPSLLWLLRMVLFVGKHFTARSFCHCKIDSIFVVAQKILSDPLKDPEYGRCAEQPCVSWRQHFPSFLWLLVCS